MGVRLRLLYHWPTLLIFAAGGLVVIALSLGFGSSRLSVHMSVFAYRDVNRNGIYDVEDRPYAGLKVTLARPTGRPVEQVSNIAGFANFDMTRNRRTGHIHSQGEYSARIEAPRNWQVTSKNETQTITVRANEASMIGLVADRTFDAVGVAPMLSISGAIEPGVLAPNAAIPLLQAHSPHGDNVAVAIAEDGAFSLPATEGTWRLELSGHGERPIARDVTVGRYAVVLSRHDGSATRHASLRPNLRTIGFDELTSSDTLYEIPNGYAGLDWRNWVATHQKLYGGDGYVNAAVSSEYLAYTSSGHPATISAASEFDFVGAFVGAAWAGTEEYDVVVRAWRQDQQVHEDRFRVSVAGPIYFDADYRDISRLEFSSDGYWQIAVDDITIRTD